jgi:hypothetical protein
LSSSIRAVTYEFVNPLRSENGENVIEICLNKNDLSKSKKSIAASSSVPRIEEEENFLSADSRATYSSKP